MNPEFILIVGSIGMLLLTIAIVSFIYLYQRKLIKRKISFQQIEELLKKQELKSAYALLEGQDKERKKIAKELHDNLGSILVSINMYLDTALESNIEKKKNELISRTRDIIIQASEETRKLSHQLDSATLLHFGLESAIKDIIQTVSDNKSIEINSFFHLSNSVKNEIAFNLYRILQELINNTLKHAHAHSITIDLTEIKNEYINLIYEDDGIGFVESQVKLGLGLNNIKARVAKLNGILTSNFKNKKGISVIIEIPLT